MSETETSSHVVVSGEACDRSAVQRDSVQWNHVSSRLQRQEKESYDG